VFGTSFVRNAVRAARSVGPPTAEAEDTAHAWRRVCTTVVAGRPLVVEYRCSTCGAWTVEQTERLPW
jgi:hypothetical protein